MRVDEARLMADWVKSLGFRPGTVCLNIGSSTQEFRTVMQPHIDALLIRPLEQEGLRIVHCDMKAAEGVDEVGDLLDPGFRERLRSYDAQLMICSNLLEHLADPKTFARACGDLVKAGGYGLFTVPLSYPYHPDPIDTMLRLDSTELAALMADWQVVKSAEILAGNYLDDLRKEGRTFSTLTKQVARTLLPFYRPQMWRPNAHRLLWLFRPYRQSMVLLRKPG